MPVNFEWQYTSPIYNGQYFDQFVRDSTKKSGVQLFGQYFKTRSPVITKSEGYRLHQ